MLIIALFSATCLIAGSNKTPDALNDVCNEKVKEFAAAFKAIIESYDKRILTRGYPHVDDAKNYREEMRKLEGRIFAFLNACPTQLDPLFTHVYKISQYK